MSPPLPRGVRGTVGGGAALSVAVSRKRARPVVARDAAAATVRKRQHRDERQAYLDHYTPPTVAEQLSHETKATAALRRKLGAKVAKRALHSCQHGTATERHDAVVAISTILCQDMAFMTSLCGARVMQNRITTCLQAQPKELAALFPHHQTAEVAAQDGLLQRHTHNYRLAAKLVGIARRHGVDHFPVVRHLFQAGTAVRSTPLGTARFVGQTAGSLTFAMTPIPRGLLPWMNVGWPNRRRVDFCLSVDQPPKYGLHPRPIARASLIVRPDRNALLGFEVVATLMAEYHRTGHGAIGLVAAFAYGSGHEVEQQRAAEAE